MYLQKKLLCVILNLLFAIVNSIESVQNAFFRKDYIFLEGPQSFFKIHTIHRTWHDGKRRCAMEGAKYYYPDNAAEVSDLITYWNKTQGYHWIYVGISDLVSKGAFETYDGIPVSDIYDNWAQGEPNDNGGNEDCVILRRDGELNDTPCHHKYPFVCKKTLAAVEWNTLCEIPDPTYLYNPEVGKCYKYHKKPMNWVDAYSICYAEQSYLAVINNKKEAEHLENILKNAQKPKGDALNDTIFIGFHNRDDDGWKTIKGMSLEESGYDVWADNQPDNQGKDLCGGMMYNGKLNDVNCESKAPFICEHDVGALISSFDDRISGNV